MYKPTMLDQSCQTLLKSRCPHLLPQPITFYSGYVRNCLELSILQKYNAH